MTTADSEQPDPTASLAPVTAADWDARYGTNPIWSGQPNGALITETSPLPPGRALDVGCGEGADAVWLATRGWAVTGLDVSAVALGRAARHAEDAGVGITWVLAGLLDADLPAGGFDLVSAQYPALRRTGDRQAERALQNLVAPGGTLLVVHHHVDPAIRHDGFDPADWVGPAQVAESLDEGDWAVETMDRRQRPAPPGGAGAHHTEDVVLRARRR